MLSHLEVSFRGDQRSCLRELRFPPNTRAPAGTPCKHAHALGATIEISLVTLYNVSVFQATRYICVS